MPLQIRSRDGTIQPAPQDCALEYTDNFGRLALVIFQRGDGSVKIATPGDPDFNAYSHINRVPASRVTVHEPPPTRRHP